MRIGISASLSLTTRSQLDLLENVDALARKESDNRLFPGTLLSVDPASTTPNRARASRALHIHGVDGLHPHIEEFLDRLANLDLVRDRRHLKRVLVMLHEVGVLLGGRR